MFPFNQNSNVYTGSESYAFFSFSLYNEMRVQNMINDLNIRKCHIWYDMGIEKPS